MPRLPQNPTKTELIEKYWYEFLQWCQETNDKASKLGNAVDRAFSSVSPTEANFWEWYMDHKLEAGDALSA